MPNTIPKPGIGASKELNSYWLMGEGKAKWADKPHPWTSLYHELLKYMTPDKAKGLTTEYYIRVFGHGPERNTHHD